MDKGISYKCKLFYCPERKKYVCCAGCERKDTCEGRCRNSPEKCGYSLARICSDEVVCPFFIWTSYRNTNEIRRITCEGIIPGTNDITEFSSDSAKGTHMLKFCCTDYVSCERARELLRMYDEGERDTDEARK